MVETFCKGKYLSHRSRPSRWHRILLSACLAVAAAITPIAAIAPAAQAAPVVGFNAGNIIDDSLFYNGNAMSTAEIQTFLNSKLSACKIGTPGYMPGDLSPSGSGNIIASNCLKDFRQTTTSQPGDAYCAAYAGAVNETSAQIIAKVGQACGISQKVLLVMLEKEQSLITDSWPVTRQYNYALGMNCPDSGPNGSANCDAASAGFSKQLYLGARQLKVYKGNPNSFNYKPFQYNNIQWHPNSGCGTSSVYIENWATAALYIYTPYRPNQAALNAGWGTGDGCSSYGNRNFFLFYTSWFGDTHGYEVRGDIAAYWNARGGSGSVFGYPTGASTFYTTRFAGGLWLQYFSGGIITTEMNTGKTVGIPFGQVFSYYNLEAGGIFGALGAPVAEPSYYSASGGATLQWFQGGLMVSSNATGKTASVAFGPVYDLYNDTAGGIYGVLGYPVSGFTQYTGGKLQSFQRGVIAQAAGAQKPVWVAGSIYDYYNGVAGGIRGRLGFPLADAVALSSGAISQEFAGGFLVQTVTGEIAEISGPILVEYRRAERESTPLGAPVGSKITLTEDGGADLLQFENGVVVTEKRSGVTSAVFGSIFEHYNGVLGGVRGAYGYPTASVAKYSVNGGGSLQLFRGGIVFVSDKAESVAGMRFDSQIYKRYNGTEGGIYGWLGYPVQDEVVQLDGSKSQKFQGGTIFVTSSGAVTALSDATAAIYQARGGVEGPLGVQQGQPMRYSAGSGALLTFFAGGIITQESQTGTAASLLYSDPLFVYYNTRVGGIYGKLGYPMSESLNDSSGALAQSYQTGVLRKSPDGRVFEFTQESWSAYLASGAESGVLGTVADHSYSYSANGGGRVQFFKNGLITVENKTGSTAVLPHGPIYDYYNNVVGGIYGSLGYPVTNQTTTNGTIVQRFQNGTLTYDGTKVTRS